MKISKLVIIPFLTFALASCGSPAEDTTTDEDNAFVNAINKSKTLFDGDTLFSFTCFDLMSMDEEVDESFMVDFFAEYNKEGYKISISAPDDEENRQYYYYGKQDNFFEIYDDGLDITYNKITVDQAGKEYKAITDLFLSILPKVNQPDVVSSLKIKHEEEWTYYMGSIMQDNIPLNFEISLNKDETYIDSVIIKQGPRQREYGFIIPDEEVTFVIPDVK